MIRLLIADDHALVREGLKRLLALAPDISVAAEAENGGQVLEFVRDNSLDLVLLDMSMSGLSGVDVIAHIRSHAPRLPILVLSMHNEPQVAKRALKAGASGYLTKDSDPETLLAAIRRVAGGGRFVDADLAEQMVFEAALPAPQLPHEQLSDREFHILRLLAGGKTVNEIAEALSISNKTVSTHKTRLMQKMQFSSNSDLVKYAVSHDLVE